MYAPMILVGLLAYASAVQADRDLPANEAAKARLAARDGISCTTDVVKLVTSAIPLFPTPPPELKSLVADPSGLVTVTDLCSISFAPALAAPFNAYKSSVFSWGGSFYPQVTSILSGCPDMRTAANVASGVARLATAAASIACDKDSPAGKSAATAVAAAGGSSGSQGPPQIAVKAAGLALLVFVGAVVAL